MRQKLPRNSCLSCGKEVNRPEKVYCDGKCQMRGQREKYIQEWKLGMHDGMRGRTAISKHIRQYLFEKFNSTCTRCGWSEVNTHTGNVPLEVEHLDGNSENNIEENLTLLCPNCHSLTATYKGANRGSGRWFRKQRYQEGKSY